MSTTWRRKEKKNGAANSLYDGDWKTGLACNLVADRSHEVKVAMHASPRLYTWIVHAGPEVYS